MDPLERLLSKVEKDPATGCWNFLSSIHRIAGHGRLAYKGKQRDAYRLAYELIKGPIEPGKHLHHICENRRCVNPDHLLPVTIQEHFVQHTPNSIAFKNARKTECPKGHPLTPDNLVKSCPRRRCLICTRIKVKTCKRAKYWRDLGFKHPPPPRKYQRKIPLE